MLGLVAMYGIVAHSYVCTRLVARVFVVDNAASGMSEEQERGRNVDTR